MNLLSIKRILMPILILVVFFIQHLLIANELPAFEVLEQNRDGIKFRLVAAKLEYNTISTNYGEFVELDLEGFLWSNDIGKPALPVLRKLIELPDEDSYEIKILKIQLQEISLSDIDINAYILPVQAPLPKCEGNPFSWSLDTATYQRDEYFGFEWVTISPLGNMRGADLARLDISPVRYNPVSNMIQYLNLLEVEIIFDTEEVVEDQSIPPFDLYYSPFFEAIYGAVINHSTLTPRDLITDSPVTMIIVADPVFEESLQDFVIWKRQKGFKVVEAYTNNPEVGNTTISIKSYLQGFYENPPDGYLPQSFVLLVGDIQQMPSFNGNTGAHVTDLYFAEYTGDILPDCIIGRFSANTALHVQAQVEKSVNYEKYLLPETQWLKDALLIAGADASHQDWSNGQINYAMTYYLNEAHDIQPHYFLQPNPPGWNVHDSIIYWVNHGIMFANYTAHCGVSGWSDPSFTLGDISGLNNTDRYGLLVGNCCSSASFGSECFGEEIVRAPGKGALGYIGGSDLTYWDEDYWWAVGFKNIIPNPQYDPDALGMYDRTFHDYNEPLEEWFITQGQMVHAGNLAITQSGSSIENYYWEIYHLLGDPSLMIYFSEPEPMEVVIPDFVFIGAEEINIETEPFAYIAVSQDGELSGTAIADENGIALVNLFEPIAFEGTAQVVITGQNLQPYFGDILVQTPNSPYVLVDDYSFDENEGNGNGLVDFGESIHVNLSLKNHGGQAATNLAASLNCTDDQINLTVDYFECPDIEPEEIITLESVFSLDVNSVVEDGHIVIMEVVVSDETDNWVSEIEMELHAPLLSVAEVEIMDNSGNGLLEPGEEGELIFHVLNNGSASIDNVTFLLQTDSDWLSIVNEQVSLGTINANGESEAIFEVFASAAAPEGSLVELIIVVDNPSGYVINTQQTIFLGNPPVLIIDMDQNHNSAHVIQSHIIDKNLAAAIVEEVPDDLNLYEAVFVCLGMYGQNHVLTADEGSMLATYVLNNGNLYMEGGDTWSYDPSTPVHNLFNIFALIDGNGELEEIHGMDGTIAQDLLFTYSGDNSSIDRLGALQPALVILQNQLPSYGVCVANSGEGYKTIGSSVEFGGLNENDKSAGILMHRILNFFGLTGEENLIAYFGVNNRYPQPGSGVNFTDLSLGTPLSWQWTFEGGNPASSDMQNPTVFYPDAGDFNVTLTVMDATNSYTFSVEEYMHVSVGMEEFILADKITLYPNPAQNQFIIEFPEKIDEDINLEICDINGAVISHNIIKVNSSRAIPVNVTGLDQGIYLCRLKLQEAIILKKLLIK